MSENGLDAIVLMEGTSLKYFTGIRWWGGERTFALVLPAKGSAFYVCPGFEEGRAREQITNAPDGEQPDVRIWQEDESPYQRIAQGLKERGIASGKLGIEETVRFVFAEGISKASPQVTVASATPVTAGCRMIKSAHEVALMRLAAQVTLAAYEAAYHRGERWNDTAATGIAGAEGTRAARLHRRRRRAGRRILCLPPRIRHAAGRTRGHHRPHGWRMFGRGIRVGHHTHLRAGQSTDKMKQVFDIVHRAQSAALATARPGVECGSVDAAARKVVTDGGYGPDYKYFTHRLGHGMGMDGHEWPYLVRGNPTKLQANMTTSDEPGIYIRGEFGIRLEDDMHVTEDGAELFTPQSPSLENPFGKA